MAHVALIITGLRGKLNASFEIASRLGNEGHEVTYISPKDIESDVIEQGFRFMKAPSINFDCSDSNLDNSNTSYLKRLSFHFTNGGLHYKRGKKLLNLAEYKSILKSLNPDRVLVDLELHEFIFTAIELNIPVTLFTTWFSDKMSLKLPPIRTAIMPGSGFKGTKLGILFAWVYLRTRFRLRLILDYIALKHYRRFVLLRYAREIGFDTQTLLPNNFPPLFSYKQLPIVTMAMKELDFPHDFPKNYTYAGPMVYLHRERNEKESNRVKEVQRIIAHKTNSNKKLIYCSIGTYIEADVQFLKRVIDAVEKELNWILIISLGHRTDISEFKSIPDNIHFFSYVPQLEVLKYTDCSINHGGVNSINECIHFKVPMLVYSGNRYDQNGCAARIGYHGLGLMGNKNLDDAKGIHDNIEMVLNAEHFKDKIEKFNAIYEAYRDKEITPLIFV